MGEGLFLSALQTKWLVGSLDCCSYDRTAWVGWASWSLCKLSLVRGHRFHPLVLILRQMPPRFAVCRFFPELQTHLAKLGQEGFPGCPTAPQTASKPALRLGPTPRLMPSAPFHIIQAQNKAVIFDFSFVLLSTRSPDSPGFLDPQPPESVSFSALLCNLQSLRHLLPFNWW